MEKQPTKRARLDASFHPAVAGWFEKRFGEPTEPQVKGWPAIQQGENVLIAAPTGSGKTLSAFLCAIDRLVKRAEAGRLEDRTHVLYISPLKALANDIRVNLLEPLRGIRQEAAAQGLDLPEIRPLVRSGDTPARDRRRMIQRPPHILVTTPESFFILLTSESGRTILKDVSSVIVDEIHALARDKRGSHLALSLERLEALRTETGPAGLLQRIGLSATQRPIEDVARFLSGAGRTTTVVDVGHHRPMEVAIEVPGEGLTSVASREIWEEIYDRLGQLIAKHRTTLIFVNTRRLAERLTHQLTARLGPDRVAAHHGSLARESRLKAEEDLKQGRLRAVVATASLELGIDVGTIDLVCQIGSTRSISLALQRIGRSGHWRGAIPQGRFFPVSRDDLVECAALTWALDQGRLDVTRIPQAPLDVLAQQIVAAAASREWREDELLELVRQAAPYERLATEDFEAVVAMLAEGFTGRQGRKRALLHRDRIQGRIRGRRGARLAAVTSGGAIPDNANFLVKADPEELVVGDVDEDFAAESSQGDIFLLGNASWRIRRVESGVVRVEDAGGAPPTIPFWRGEAPGRTDELSQAVSELREIVVREGGKALPWLMEHCGLNQRGAEQVVAYVQSGRAALGCLPTQHCIVAERFFDESGGMQLVLHSTFGARINRAWGLALRKRFCRSFNFELQAAATENGLLLSLSDQHSFPLDSVFSFLSSRTAVDLLIQAMLDAPMFATRWRWNVSRALAILRFSHGRKVAPQLQRIRSDDLLASVFPESAACLENITGDRRIPDHPLVAETIRDCLTEAMDVEGWLSVLRALEGGGIQGVAIDTREPSPLSHEILNANPYAFLDDAPLEERRARAVYSRRTLTREEMEQFGTLDPAGVRQAVEECAPSLESADEVHDALLSLGLMREEELPAADRFLLELEEQRRAFRMVISPGPESGEEEPSCFWLAAERAALIERLYPPECIPGLGDTELRDRLAGLWERDRSLGPDEAARELVRGRLESSGPFTAPQLARWLALPDDTARRALAALEAEGQVLRGKFTPGCEVVEWCDRRILSRIHRLTLGRLRRDIEPVSRADFMRFLFQWQHVVPGARLHGATGLRLILHQLQGFEAPAAAWEPVILARRIAGYEPAILDGLCLSGQFVWGRLSVPEAQSEESESRAVRPTRLAPISFFERQQVGEFLQLRRSGEDQRRSQLTHAAREVLEALEHWGASFVGDLVRATGRLPVEVELGLWELVTLGLATADSFDNLRSLIDPKRRLVSRHRLAAKKRRPAPAMSRWSLLDFPRPAGGQGSSGASGDARPASHTPKMPSAPVSGATDVEFFAVQLLRRWGVVFKSLLQREGIVPSWWDLVRIYRRREARGEIRGGRFVAGFAGEQYALPEAVDALRRVRRREAEDESITISAADPLNLIGIVLPGEKVRSRPETLLTFKNGLPQADSAPALR
ncbi:MAG: DEAD/DEAH box helicase [Acidobacteriota bacterium]